MEALTNHQSCRFALVFHTLMWGIIIALALGVAVWSVAKSREINLPVGPAVLSWRLAEGQDAVIENVVSYRVYYKTLQDNVLSERQAADGVFDPVAKTWTVALPTYAIGFRLDAYCRDLSGPGVTEPPRLASISLGGRGISLRRLNPLVETNLKFAAWTYDESFPLNGWGFRLVSLALVAWAVLVFVVHLLIRKAVS